jgi:hypothetical protein
LFKKILYLDQILVDKKKWKKNIKALEQIVQAYIYIWSDSVYKWSFQVQTLKWPSASLTHTKKPYKHNELI